MIRVFCQGCRQTCVNAVDRRSNPHRLFDGKSIDAESGRSALRDQEPVDRLKKRILPGARLMTHRGLLKKIPPFDCLNPQEFDQLSSLLQEVSLVKGEKVCSEGEEGESLFLIVSGELEVWGSAEGKMRVINRMVPGDFFGEITLLTGGRRTATITAATDSRLLVLDRSGFESFFVQNPKILEYVARVLAQRLARVSRGQLPPRRSLVISVTGKPGVRGKSLTASVLAGLNPSLQTHGFYRKRSQGCRKSVTEYQGCNCRETLRRISAMKQTA